MNKGKKVHMDARTRLLVILVDISCGLVVLAGIILDICFRVGENPNIGAAEFISALSVDSFLSIVSIIAAVLIPMSEHRVPRKYNISTEDYDKLTNSSDVPLYHMLGFAIAFLLGNGFFYAFDCRYSLLFTFVATIGMICAYVIPRIYSSARAEDGLMRSVTKTFTNFCNSHQEWRSEIFKDEYNDKEHNKVLNEILIQILIENGFDYTLNELSNSYDDDDKKKGIYLYLFDLLKNKIDSFSTTQDMNNELSNMTLEKYIQCSSSICLYTTMISKLTPDEQQTLCEKFADHLNNLDKIIDSDKFSDYLFTDLHEIIRKIMRCINRYKKFTTFYLSLIITIFTKDEFINDPWIIKALGHSLENRPTIMSITSNYYYVMVVFYVLYLQINNEFSPQVADTITATLTNKFSPYISRYLRSKHVLSRLDFLNMAHSVYDAVEFIHPENTSVRRSIKSNRELQNYLCFATDIMAPYLLILNYFQRKEEVDDILLSMDTDDLEKIRHDIRYLNFDDFTSILAQLKDCRLYTKDISREDFNAIVGYIYFSDKRIDEINKVKEKIGLDNFINEMNKCFSKMPFFQDCIKEEQVNDTTQSMSNEGKTGVCIKKNEVLSVNNVRGSFHNPEFFLKINCAKMRDRSLSVQTISEYDKSTLNSIINFGPNYRHAPKFDKFISDKKAGLVNLSKKISKLPDEGEAFINPSHRLDMFFKKDAFKFKFKITNEGTYIRPLSKSEAIAYLRNTNPKQYEFSDSEVDSIIDNYYYLCICYDSLLIYRDKEILLFDFEANRKTIPLIHVDFNESVLDYLRHSDE